MFRDMHVGWPGSVHDANSQLFQRETNKEILTGGHVSFSDVNIFAISRPVHRIFKRGSKFR